MEPTISWTPELLERLKQAYDETILAGLEEFKFWMAGGKGEPTRFKTSHALVILKFYGAHPELKDK